MIDILSQPEVPAHITRYLIEFEAFFTRLAEDHAMSREGRIQWRNVCDGMTHEWNQSLLCEEKANQLQSQRQDNVDQKQALDIQISEYQTLIVELQRKIVDPEAKKASLDSSEGLPSQEVVNQEAQEGIKHVEKALELKKRADKLERKISLRLEHERVLFEDFKARFPI